MTKKEVITLKNKNRTLTINRERAVKNKRIRARDAGGTVIEAVDIEEPKLLEKIRTILTHFLNKKDESELENYQLKSLLNRLYKLLTKRITNRLEGKLVLYQPKEQVAFNKTFGTNDQL